MAIEGNIVLIYHQEHPTVFARVEHIEPDMKKDWYHVTLLLLTIPTQTVTWILRDKYIDGEVFTMGGKEMRLEEVKKVTIREDKQSLARNETKTSGKPAVVLPFKKP
ncbi:MAG TPA: hypothetical protein HPP41_01550 [Deltaproteobacteria bacterium]|nr:hypothetical protein [Deltaproteobacteria bacterium]